MRLVFLFLLYIPLCFGEKKPKVARVTSVEQLESVLKARHNVLVYYHLEKASLGNTLIDLAEEVQGTAIVAFIYCDSQDGHVVCEEMGVKANPFVLRHYYRGVFNLDYNREISVDSLKKFLLNPLEEIPWSEQLGADNVVQIESEDDFIKCLNGKKQTLFFFYTPDNTDCRKLIPIWNDLADKYENRFQFAAINMKNKLNAPMGKVYQIKKYPSLQYFEDGVHMFAYEGKLDANSIAEWIKKPKRSDVQAHSSDPRDHWENQPDSLVNHLSEDSFEDFIDDHSKVLVVFHAPWCGFCKKLQPVIENVARKVNAERHDIVIAAIDGSKNERTRKKYSIDGYPKIKYFKNGKVKSEIKERLEEQIMRWIRNPSKSPAVMEDWSKESKDVHFLNEKNWEQVEDKQHSFIMFYAPWCGHCKSTKPIWQDIAAVLKRQSQFFIGAVDCTIHKRLCQKEKVGAYPSFKYYFYGELRDTYRQGRTQAAFIEYLQSKETLVLGHEEL
ncbi:unnamed protein product [Auanema sp. JU1783]|nr:unnamed protein product [Auanema sp. JU1783]